MSKVVSFEPQVNSTMEYFFERLDRVFADKDQVCSFSFWLQAFAFDVIGEITFSKRIGFLEKGEDIDGIMGSIWKYFTAASPVSRSPGVGPISPLFDMHQSFSSAGTSILNLAAESPRLGASDYSDSNRYPKCHG